MQNFKKAIACIFILVGGFGLPTSLLSLFNPFGAKLYNADDPLGLPVSTSASALAIGLHIIMLVAGIWLAVSGRRDREDSQPNDEVKQ